MCAAIIILHLDQYYTDQRKCSKLYINEKFKIINDLQEYIKHVFGINSKFCLLDISSVPHILIPRSEDIRVLQGITHVTLQEVSNDFKVNLDNPRLCNGNLTLNESLFSPPETLTSKIVKKIKKLSYESNQQNDTQNYDEAKTPQNKFSIISDVVIKGLDGKNLQNTKFTNEDEKIQEPLINNLDPNNINNSILYPAKFMLKSNEKVNLTPILERSEIRYSTDNVDHEMDTICEAESSICENDSSLVQNENITTRGRKRIRKKKRSIKTATPETPVALPREVALLRKAVESLNARPSSRASHIRFEEKEDLESTLDGSINSSLNNSLNNSTNYENPQLSSTLEKQLRLTDIAKKAKIVKGFTKENTVNEPQNFEETSSNAWEQLCNNFNPQEYPNLMDLPEQDDIIGFRMLKMTDSYEPELSKYIFGMVLEIEKKSQIGDSDLTIQILAGFENCLEPSGKFQLPDETSESNTDNLILNLKWMNIIEPKKVI